MTRQKVLVVFTAAALAVSATAQQQTQQQTQQQQTQQQQTQPGMGQQDQFGQQQFGQQYAQQFSMEGQEGVQALMQLVTYLQRLEQRIAALERQVQGPRALQRARAGLQELSPRVTAGDEQEALLEDFGRIRAELERGFTGVRGPAQQRWTDLTSELGQFEERFRTGEAIGEQEWQQFLGRFDDPAWQQEFEQDFDFDAPTMQEQRGQQALQQARARVTGLRERVLAGEDREDVAREFGDIRTQLERNFDTLTGVDQQRWSLMRTQWQQFEEDIRAGEDIDDARWQEFEGGFEGWIFRQQPGQFQQQPGTTTQPGMTPGAGAMDDDNDEDNDEENDNDDNEGDNGGN